MEKIFCDFCKKEIKELSSTIEYKTNFIHFNRGKEMVWSADTIDSKYDLCPDCNEIFKNFLKTQVKL